MTLIPALIVAASISLHPLHVAYTNIEIDPEQKTISVTHKIFTNDFTLLFFHLFEKNIIPQENIEFQSAEIDLIDQYMEQRYILLTVSHTIRLNYKSKQLEEETLWLYYSGRFEKDPPLDLTINNLLLLDLYIDQTNLVIVNHGPSEKGLTFNWDNRQSVVALKE
jgi:hypothetical protein